MDGTDHAEHEPVVNLIEVQPLPEDTIRRQEGPHALVELVGEESADTAHPRIRRLTEDQIELPIL